MQSTISGLIKMFGPKQSAESVASVLIRGLEDGSIVLDDEGSTKHATRDDQISQLFAEIRANLATAELQLSPPARICQLKRIADLVIGIALFTAAAPLLLVTAILIRLTSAGPALYSQWHVGLNGCPLRLLKFRTVYHRYPTHFTPLGIILRRLHFDELPQILNVIAGELSLAGPRQSGRSSSSCSVRPYPTIANDFACGQA